MTPRQKQLLEEVYDALVDPANSPYFGMEFRKAARLLADKLDEINQIETYVQPKEII